MTTKEKTYRLRKIMHQWHVGIYDGDEMVSDNPFASFAEAKAFADELDMKDGDRG